MPQQLEPHLTEVSPNKDSVRKGKTLLGFVLESEPMPDDEQEVLYTLTHPDLPGLAYSGVAPWECLLAGIQAAERILNERMRAGEILQIEE